MNTIEDIRSCTNAVVAGLGHKAQEYKDLLAQGKITQAEYDSLCASLVNVDAIVEAADTEEVKQQFRVAAEVLIKFLA